MYGQEADAVEPWFDWSLKRSSLAPAVPPLLSVVQTGVALVPVLSWNAKPVVAAKSAISLPSPFCRLLSRS